MCITIWVKVTSLLNVCPGRIMLLEQPNGKRFLGCAVDFS